MKTILEEGYVLYAIGGVIFLGILCKLLSGLAYRKFRKQSENMGATENKILKQMRVKFENSYRANHYFNNIPVFVDKYVSKYRFMGMSFHQMDKLTGQFILLEAILAGAAAAVSFYMNYGFKTILFYVLTGVGGGLILFLTDRMFDGKYRQKQIEVNIKDYLENSLINRVINENGVNAVAERPSTAEALRDDLRKDMDYMKNVLDEIAAGMEGGKIPEKAEKNVKVKSTDDRIIQDVLKEFLT